MAAATRTDSVCARAARWLARAAPTRGAIILGLLFGALASPALATTYTYTGAVYASTVPFPGPCGAGTCTNYTTAMSLTGSFTTAAPLGANLANVDIAALVTSFSFNDGINTYSSADPNTRILSFHAATDSSGVPSSSMFLDIEKWITGSTPHSGTDRYSEFDIDSSVDVVNNLPCTGVGTTGGTADTCTSGSGSDNSTSSASNGTAGVWAIAGGSGGGVVGFGATTPANVPTLSQWALLLLIASVCGAGVAAAHRRRRRR